MVLKDTQERLEAFLEHKEEFKKVLRRVCVNKTIPVNERWEMFIKSDLGRIKSSFPCPDGCKNNDDFPMLYSWEKYKLVLIKDWLNDDEQNEVNHIIDTDAFKEYFLERFEKGFKFDW